MMNRPRPRSKWADRADDAVAKFTRNILGLANKANVDFDPAGNKGTQADEVRRVMSINSGVVEQLMKR